MKTLAEWIECAGYIVVLAIALAAVAQGPADRRPAWFLDTQGNSLLPVPPFPLQLYERVEIVPGTTSTTYVLPPKDRGYALAYCQARPANGQALNLSPLPTKLAIRGASVVLTHPAYREAKIAPVVSLGCEIEEIQ